MALDICGSAERVAHLDMVAQSALSVSGRAQAKSAQVLPAACVKNCAITQTPLQRRVCLNARERLTQWGAITILAATRQGTAPLACAPVAQLDRAGTF